MVGLDVERLTNAIEGEKRVLSFAVDPGFRIAQERSSALAGIGWSQVAAQRILEHREGEQTLARKGMVPMQQLQHLHGKQRLRNPAFG